MGISYELNISANQGTCPVTLKQLVLTVWEIKDSDVSQIYGFENPRKRVKGQFSRKCPSYEKSKINQVSCSVTLKCLALTVWKKKDSHVCEISGFENPGKKDKWVVFMKVSTPALTIDDDSLATKIRI